MLKQLILIVCVYVGYIAAEKADLVIFSYDRPLQLWALLESIELNMSNVGDTFVVYRTSHNAFDSAYQEVINRFAHITYLKQSGNPQEDFKYLTLRAIKSGTHPYIFFAVDDIVVTGPVDIDAAIQALEETKAYGFYLRLGLHLDYCYPMNASQAVPHGVVYNDSLFVWQFQHGEHDWRYPHTVDMTIFRKKTVEEQIPYLSFTSPNTLEAQWAGRAAHTNRLYGVCNVQSPVVNLPINKVQKEYGNRHAETMSPYDLLAFFSKGLKMDIKPLQGYINKAAHEEYEPTFIMR